MNEKIGTYSFAVGVLLAIVLGLAQNGLDANAKGILSSLLIVLGIVVGLVNVTSKETKEFLICATILIIASALGSGEFLLSSIGSLGGIAIGSLLGGLFGAILVFTTPAVIVVSIKRIFTLAKTK